MKLHVSAALAASVFGLRVLRGIVPAGLALLGCGGHGSFEASTADAPIAECDAYVSAVKNCLRASGPEALAAGEAGLATLRASLKAETDDGRAALRARCVVSTQNAKEACR